MDKKIVSVVGLAALFACGVGSANAASDLVANPTAVAKVQQTDANCSGNANDTCTGNCCAGSCGGCCAGCAGCCGTCSGDNCSGDENCSGNSGPAGSK